MTPQGNINFTLEHMENAKGEAMPIAPGDGYTVWLPVPQDLELNYALLMRNFSGETTRNPHGKWLISIIFPGWKILRNRSHTAAFIKVIIRFAEKHNP